MSVCIRSEYLWPMIFLTFIAWKWIEGEEHKACLQSGGDVVLGWFQDGCAVRKATP